MILFHLTGAKTPHILIYNLFIEKEGKHCKGLKVMRNLSAFQYILHCTIKPISNVHSDNIMVFDIISMNPLYPEFVVFLRNNPKVLYSM